MINRRQFVTRTAGTLSALAISPAAAFADQLNAISGLSDLLDRELTGPGAATGPELMAGDEKFWARVRSAYTLNPRVVNLDHGWTNPTTRAAVDDLVRGARRLEALPAEELGRLFFGDGSARLYCLLPTNADLSCSRGNRKVIVETRSVHIRDLRSRSRMNKKGDINGTYSTRSCMWYGG